MVAQGAAMPLPAVPPLPTGGLLAGDKPDVPSKLSARSLLVREDSLIFTPRPIKAGSVGSQDGVLSPSEATSPVNSEGSYTGSYASSNGPCQVPAWPPQPQPSTRRLRQSPFITALKPAAAPQAPAKQTGGGYEQGQLLALVEAALGAVPPRPSLLLRRVCSAPTLDIVPEEIAPATPPRGSFKLRTAYSTDAYETSDASLPSPPRVAQQAQPASDEPAPALLAPTAVFLGSFSSPMPMQDIHVKPDNLGPIITVPRRRNVVQSVMVSHPQQQLEELFLDANETVVCEIRIPDRPANKADTHSGRMTIVFADNWQMPLEEFPFSPCAGSAPRPSEAPARARRPAFSAAWRGLFSKMFRRWGCAKLKQL